MQHRMQENSGLEMSGKMTELQISGPEITGKHNVAAKCMKSFECFVFQTHTQHSNWQY